MKKMMFFAVAALTMVFFFGSCKVETSKVTVSVVDESGEPVPNRYVFYTDMASAITGTVLPDPTDLMGLDSWEYGQTNAQGVVTFSFDLAVSKLTYYFYVLDAGSNQWKNKEITLKKGENADIEFVVNR